MTAVSHCLHNAYKIVIKNQTQGSHGIYLEIQGGFRQNICWCFHKDQNFWCKHGFIACAYFTGLICEKVALTDLKKYALAVFCGLLVTYIIGLSYKYFILNFYLNTPISWKLVLLSCLPIDLPCDIALSILAIILATKLKKSGGLHVKKDIK